jgi:hypothetical protein
MVNLQAKLWNQLQPISGQSICPTENDSDVLRQLEDRVNRPILKLLDLHKCIQRAKVCTFLTAIIKLGDGVSEDVKFKIKERATTMLATCQHIRELAHQRQNSLVEPLTLSGTKTWKPSESPENSGRRNGDGRPLDSVVASEIPIGQSMEDSKLGGKKAPIIIGT